MPRTSPFMRAAVLFLFASSSISATETQAQSPRRWSVIPDMRVGSSSSAETALIGVRSAFPAPGGGLYIATLRGGLQEFESTGNLTRTFGRTGDGPGEFRLVFAAGRVDSQLWTFDQRLSRVTLYQPDGAIVQAQSSNLRAAPGHTLNTVLALTHERSLVAVEAPSLPITQLLAEPGAQTRLALHTADGSGRRELETGRFGSPGFEPSPGTIVAFPYLSDHTRTAVHPRGSLIVSVHQETERRGPFEYVVRGYSAAGDRVFERRLPYTPRAISGSVLTAFLSERLGDDAAAARSRRGLHVPPHLPPVTAVLVAADFRVWLRTEESLDGAPVRWIVLTPGAGRVEAELLLPARLRLLYADAATVIGVEVGEFDEESVVRYRIGR